MNTRTFYRATTKFIAALMIVMLLPVGPAFADTAANHAGTGTSIGSGTGWSNPGNITADDTSYATVNLGWFATSEYLEGTNYGFSIPASATIDGIQVTIMRRSSSSSGGNSIDDTDVRLIKGGTITGNDYATGSDWPTSFGTATYGGPSDLWGTTWTPAEINASDFGVALSVHAEFYGRTAYVDYMQITVTYTVPLPPTTTTLTSSLNPSLAGDSVTFTATVAPAAATGTVTFYDGATSLGTGTLSGGAATFSTNALAAGPHDITAVYSGDASYSGSTSAVLVQVVNQAPTITSLLATTFAVGSPGNFTVTVSAYPAPTFALTGDTLPGGVNFDTGTGVFSGTPASGTVGVYNFIITASNGVSPDAIQNFTLTIIKGDQTIDFTAPGSATYGSTFTINPTSSSGLPVTVIESGVCTLAGNVVTMTSGTNECVLTATQAGDASYNAASDVVQTVSAQRASATVVVNPDPSQSFYSQPFTFNVTVTSTGGTPTGDVTFLSSSPNQSVTLPLVGGAVQFTISNLNVATVLGAPVAHGTIFSGTNPLRFTYNGDDNFNTDFETTSHTVYPAPTQVDVTSDINPSAQGQTVLFTVTVSTTPPGTGIPPGTVTLYDGATPIPGAIDIPLVNGVATFSTSALTFGSHNISAQYTSSDTNYATSNNTATPYVQVVARVTTTTLTSNNNPSIYGEDVTFTSTTTSASAGTITGSVSFYDGATLLGTDNTIVAGEATFTTNALIVGTHPITAVYSGGGIFSTSTSAVLDQVVDKATLDVTADDKTKTYGDADPLPFTYAYSGFLLGDDAADINTPPTCNVLVAHVNVGDYPIVCSGAADDNYTFNYIDGTLTVDQKALTITADDQTKIYFTTFTFLGTEFSTAGLLAGDSVDSVILTSTGAPQSATVAGSPYPIVIIPGSEVGTGLSNYNITYVNGSMDVVPSGTNVLTITANAQTKIYGDTFTFTGNEFTVTGLQGSDTVTSVTFTTSGTPPATDSAAVVGSYTITPSAAVGTGLSNYVIVYTPGQMDVTQRDLTFNPDDQTKVYGSVFSAYTGAFTGLRVGDNITPVYDSAGAPATATVSGSPYPITVTLDDPDGRLGNYNVTIDPAPAAVLTVTPKALTITADDQTKPYGTEFTFVGTEFTTSGLTNGDTVDTVTLTSAGAPATAVATGSPYAIVPSAAVGTGLGNYNITYLNGTMTVTKPDLVVTSNSQSKIYGDVFSAFTGSIVGIQNSDNITVTYDSLGAPADAAFGTYPITIAYSDPDGKLVNYNVIENIGTLTVGRRDLTVIADDQTKIYGDSVTLTGTITGVQPGDNITFTYSSPGAAPTAPVGTYPIAITLNDPDNKIGNYNFTLTPATLEVTLRELVVTPDDQSKEYGTWFISFTGTITGIQNGENITANYASAGSPPSAGVGTYPITATLNDPTGKLSNYDVTLNEGVLTVSSSTLTVTAENKSVVYGSPDPAFTFTYTGFAAGDTPADIDTPPTCTVAGPHTDVGAYPIVCSGGVDDAYSFTYVPGTLTVTQRALVVTPTDKTKIFGDLFTAFTGTITGIQNGEAITATYSSLGAPVTAAVGPYDITAVLNAPAGVLANYNITLNTGTLTVIQRALTVTPADKTKIYGDVFTAFTGTITGIQNGDPITATYASAGAAATATVAGSPYPITAVLNAPAGVLDNYTITNNTGSLTVTQRALVVTPDNKSKIFGIDFTAFTGVITGIQNGDDITATYASTGAPAAAPVGTYPITATLNDPDNHLSNYSVTLNTGTLTVGLSVLTVTANDQTIIYGDPDPVFTFTYAGFAAGDTAAVIDTPPTCQVAGPHNNIGSFPITCSGGIDDNYIFSYVPGTLTVTSRALTVTPDDKSKSYGDTFTAFSGTITGIQGGDNITATYASPGAPAAAAVGSYTITATLNDPGNRLSNYTVTLNTGTLTVTTRALLVTPTDASKIYGNLFTAFTGTIVGIQNGDAITVTYASPGAAATATVGTYPINATLNAPAGVLANYNVTSNTGTLTVTLRDLVVIPADKIKTYSEVFTAFTGTVIGIQNNDNITVTYDSTGAPAAAPVGTYPITATLVDPANRLPNYNVSTSTGTLTVTLASQTITVTTPAPGNAEYLSSFTVAATASSGLPVVYSSVGPCTNAGATFTMTASTGTCIVQYDQPGDANYPPAPQVLQTVNAQKANQTITVTTSAPPTALNGTSFSVAASASSGLPVIISATGSCSGGGSNTATITMSAGLGICTVTYGQSGDAYYLAATTITELVSATELPVVILDPVDAYVAPGNDATFTSTALGNPVPTVQWQVSTDGGATFTDIPGATSTTFSVTVQMTDDGAQYQAVFTNSEGSATSAPATLHMDDIAPLVVKINSVSDTGDGQLDENEVAKVSITELLVTFNENISDPADNTDPDDVTNPANYILTLDDGDGILPTSCSAAVTGSDTPITVDAVSYDNNAGSGPFVATLSLNGGTALSNGVYRLLVCGTTSITDTATNPLAGDGTAAGTDYVRNFIVNLRGGGGGGGDAGQTGFLIPVTGYAPGRITDLSDLPITRYDSLSDVTLEIPALKLRLPIVGIPAKDNTWDVNWLLNQAGWLEGSAYPGFSGNSVLTSHVTLPFGQEGPFVNLHKLQSGNKIFVHAHGNFYIYEVESVMKLDASDPSILQHEDKSWLTLVTCADYNENAETYLKRLVVKAVLVQAQPERRWSDWR